MTIIIKRNKQKSIHDLVMAVDALNVLLLSQKEDEAVADLVSAKKVLQEMGGDEQAVQQALDAIIDAFEGEHELMDYTVQRDTEKWTEVEQLSQASSRVLSLARRIRGKA